MLTEADIRLEINKALENKAKKRGEDLNSALEQAKKYAQVRQAPIIYATDGDAFEYFLKAYLSKQQKDLGEYFTPRHIVKFLVKLTNPKFGEKVYDPFCGTGGILIEAFRHIYQKMPRESKKLQILKSNTIYGGEITQTTRITKMNMILSGDGHNNIKRQDSLKNPVQGKYDVVITNMPFSLGNYAEYSAFYALGSANGNSLCIEHCLTALNKDYADGQIAIIVPEGILFDRKFTKLREYIYQNSYVENIISLPAGTFAPYSNKKEGTNDLDTFLSFRDSSEEEKLSQAGFSKLNLELVSQNNYISIPNVYKKFTFDSKYEIMALGELVAEVNLRNEGFVLAEKRFTEKVASDNTSNYKIVPPNYFAFSPPRINVGSINYNNTKKTGCSERFKEQVKNYAFGSVRQTLSFENFTKITKFVRLERAKLRTQKLENIGASTQKIANVKTELTSFNLEVPSLAKQQEIIMELTPEMRLLESQKEIVNIFHKKEQNILSKL
ncbi:15086_t:CDS:2 [Entrophospora sp. SA101]|nr:15086_t:CDS:2 [Entrophospora sp. SA101]